MPQTTMILIDFWPQYALMRSALKRLLAGAAPDMAAELEPVVGEMITELDEGETASDRVVNLTTRQVNVLRVALDRQRDQYKVEHDPNGWYLRQLEDLIEQLKIRK